MEGIRPKYYPTILQAIHLVILYIFIQTLVDFPLALYDYYSGSDLLYNPIKKVVLGVGSVLIILYYGIRKSKNQIKNIFPLKAFNPLIILPLITFFWAAHNLLEIVSKWMDQYIPAPDWFWELFSKIFESDFGWWGAFMRVAVVAPIVEELIFRGLILQGFRRNYNGYISVFFSALLFALFHLNPWQFPATFVLGLVLGWIMLRTNNIFLVILGHSINNMLVLLSITFWEQIQSHPIYLMEKTDLYYTSGLVAACSIILAYLCSIPWFRKRKNNN